MIQSKEEIKMGLFFGGYDKPGAGIDPNAPKKKGFFLYLELVTRKFTKFLQAGFIFSLFSLPLLALVYIISVFVFQRPIYAIQTTALQIMQSNGIPESEIPGQLGTITFSMCSMVSVFFVTMWGSGPLSSGLSYVFRCFTRETPVWVWSDGKDKVKENWKQGLGIMIVDLLFLFFVPLAVSFYYALSTVAGLNLVCTLIIYVLLLAMLIYTMMHPYMYQLMITFECHFKDLFKNALLLALAKLPINLILTAIALACIVLPIAFIGVMGSLAVVVAGLTVGYIVLRYPMEFYAARVIQKTFLNDKSMVVKDPVQVEYEEDEEDAQ